MLKTKLYKRYTNYIMYGSEHECITVLYKCVPYFADFADVKYEEQNLIAITHFKNKQEEHKIYVFKLRRHDFGVAIETAENKISVARFIYETREDAIFASRFLARKYEHQKWKKVHYENTFICK